MKSKLISILAIVLVITTLIFSGCNSDKKPDEAEATETTTENTPIVETTVEQTTTNKTYLTEEEIQELFIAANNMYDGWLCHGWAPELDKNNIISVGDSENYALIISDDFASVSALEKELKKYFSEEIYKHYLDGNYIMNNGKMYGCVGLGQGGDATPIKLGLTINSRSENECSFTVTRYFGQCDSDSAEYKIKLINGNWIFVEKFFGDIGLYFNNNIPWVITETEVVSEVVTKEERTTKVNKPEKEKTTAKKDFTTEEIVEMFNISANKIKVDAVKVVKNYEKRTVNRDKTSIPSEIEETAENMIASIMGDDTEPIVFGTKDEIIENYLIPEQNYVSKLKAKDVVKATCKDTGSTYEIYFKLKDTVNPTAGVGVGSVCDVIEAHEVAEDAPFVDKFTTEYYNCEVKAVIDKATGKMIHTNYRTPLVLNITVSMFGKHDISIGFTFEKDYDITY